MQSDFHSGGTWPVSGRFLPPSFIFPSLLHLPHILSSCSLCVKFRGTVVLSDISYSWVFLCAALRNEVHTQAILESVGTACFCLRNTGWWCISGTDCFFYILSCVQVNCGYCLLTFVCAQINCRYCFSVMGCLLSLVWCVTLLNLVGFVS